MKLNVAQIQGLLANNFEVTVDADAALNFTEGSELVITNLTTSHMVVLMELLLNGTCSKEFIKKLF